MIFVAHVVSPFKKCKSVLYNPRVPGVRPMRLNDIPAVFIMAIHFLLPITYILNLRMGNLLMYLQDIQLANRIMTQLKMKVLR